ncbi:MAG: LptF/LptG family permease [Acidobacteria bacterium]|nr:LptF/LptG family permease [Acidobacteriota bacterium]
MGILSRKVFWEITTGSFLGTVLFTFILFLQRLGRLFEQLVTTASTFEQVAGLFLLILPEALIFTIPIGVLVGVLIAMGRMSSDAEIVALRAAGVPSRRLLIPVLAFSLLGLLFTAYASCILKPWAKRETIRILNQMVAAQLTAEIRPRLFEEQFPNRILYVEDVVPGPVVRWKKVFMADLRPPSERDTTSQQGEGPRITLASEAIALPDVVNNRIQLLFASGKSYEVGQNAAQYISTEFPKMNQALDAPQRREITTSDFSDVDMTELREKSTTNVDAAIEYHRRLALPVACVILAVLAVPLGVSSRKGGKSAAFVLTVVLAFLYYMGLISVIALARQGSVSASLGVWIPNILYGVLALVLVLRLEAPDDTDWTGGIRERVVRAGNWLLGRTPFSGEGEGIQAFRLPLLPQVVDTYILSGFLYYFVVLLISFVLMTHVFTFFELLGDIIKNKIAMPRVATYHLFLTPKLIYDFAPMSILVAVLLTFGVLARANEIIAFKACGVSAYRLTLPILVAGTVLSGGLFAFDYYIVPEANLIQDAIRNEIKGRPVQTFLRPDRKWIFGRGPWVYYYKHLDPTTNVMIGVNVYELDRQNFQMRRHIYAESARWEPSINRWVFQNGWRWDFQGIRGTFQSFLGNTSTFTELDEPPNHFLREVKQDIQMNFHQLADYIAGLQQSGMFDTTKLQVQYHRKFAVPLFVLIMALISTPFAFFSGNRGAMAPVGISLAIAICYLAISKLFEQMGNVGQLPPQLSAWSPDVIFSLAGMYFLMRVRT